VCVVFSLARYDTVSGTRREIRLMDTTSTPSCWPSKVGPSFSVLLSRQLTQQSPCLVTMALFTGKRTHRGWQSPSPQCLWMRCPANGHGYSKWLTFRISFEVGLNLILIPLTNCQFYGSFCLESNLCGMAILSVNQMVFVWHKPISNLVHSSCCILSIPVNELPCWPWFPTSNLTPMMQECCC